MKICFDELLIAPCGINCNICRAHLKDKNNCVGCMAEGNKANHCLTCGIRNCENLRIKSGLYIHCSEFPCKLMRRLDERYRTRYNVSVIKNLEYIKNHDRRKFLNQEERLWIKPKGILCMHDKKIYPNKS